MIIFRNSGIGRHGRKVLTGPIEVQPWFCRPPTIPLRTNSTTRTTTTTQDIASFGAEEVDPFFVPDLFSLPSSQPPPESQPDAAPPPKSNTDRASDPKWDPSIPRRHAAGQKAYEAVPRDYKIWRAIGKQTRDVGSDVKVRYSPGQLLGNPPPPHHVSLELLLASQTHIGHHTSLWNPANSRYIYGVRAGVHIISLEATAAHLRRAARVVEDVAFRGGLILFVGTRRGHMEIVVRAAELGGACHLFNRWTPGTITNRDQILAKQELRMVDEQDRTIPGFETHLDERRPVTPDLVVCLNPLENYTLLYECGLANIPTIGVIDTDSDPTWVTYTIPANDDSSRSVAVIAGVLGRAAEAGQKRRRIEAVERKRAMWQNRRDVQKFILTTARRKAAEQMKEIQKEKEEAAQAQRQLKAKRREEMLEKGIYIGPPEDS